MSNEIPMKIARQASEWWADRINGSARHDNGDRGSSSLMAGMMADSMNKPVTAEQQEKFIEALSAALVAEAPPNYSPEVCLRCDYHPNQMLADAAEKAGIPEGNFPWKTTCWVSAKGVRVSAGYCAPVEELAVKD